MGACSCDCGLIFGISVTQVVILVKPKLMGHY